MGSDEYSFHFVLAAFLPVLERIGPVTVIDHLDDAEPIRAACELSGESCAILSFVAPHKTTLFMRVPLIPVFAWEFESIPFEEWDGQPKHDWRMVLQQQGRAITLSQHSASVVRATMGESFPVIGVPPPVFDRMAGLRSRIGGRLPTSQSVMVAAIVIDSRELTLSADMPIPALPARRQPLETPSEPAVPAVVEPAIVETQRPSGPASVLRRVIGIMARDRRSEPVPAPSATNIEPHEPDPSPVVQSEPEPPTFALDLGGIVYLAILDPVVRRKNWEDLLTGFTWALRDRRDATLVIKIVSGGPEGYWEDCFTSLRKQPAFVCRVVLIDGFLDEAEMGQLLECASFVVNAASGEGCGLPLLEGMSVGRPAIAPDHTAMADYIDPSNAFVVASHLEATRFPQDGRVSWRTMWHVPRWDTLHDAFRESYIVAKDDPVRWLVMAEAAMDAQRRLCADAVVEARLRSFLGVPAAEPLLTPVNADLLAIPVQASADFVGTQPC
jgi:glycosyltransferase involved in cell wall biosynthesis